MIVNLKKHETLAEKGGRYVNGHVLIALNVSVYGTWILLIYTRCHMSPLHVVGPGQVEQDMREGQRFGDGRGAATVGDICLSMENRC